MSTTLITSLLAFIAIHASGILTGVVGTKISQFVAGHLKTDAEKKIYEDIMLPVIQSLAALLQNVPASVVAAQEAAAPALTAATTVTKTTTATIAKTAPARDEGRYNE